MLALIGLLAALVQADLLPASAFLGTEITPDTNGGLLAMSADTWVIYSRDTHPTLIGLTSVPAMLANQLQAVNDTTFTNKVVTCNEDGVLADGTTVISRVICIGIAIDVVAGDLWVMDHEYTLYMYAYSVVTTDWSSTSVNYDASAFADGTAPGTLHVQEACIVLAVNNSVWVGDASAAYNENRHVTLRETHMPATLNYIKGSAAPTPGTVCFLGDEAVLCFGLNEMCI